MMSNILLIVNMLSDIKVQYTEYRYSDRHLSCVTNKSIMLSIIMLNVIMLSAMLSIRVNYADCHYAECYLSQLC